MKRVTRKILESNDVSMNKGSLGRTTTMMSAGLAALLMLSACGSSDAPPPDAEDQIAVMASFYPLRFVAEEVGGDLVNVSTLTPDGVDAHDLEVSPAQVRALGDSELVVYASGFQPAVDEAIRQNAPEHVVDATDYHDDELVGSALDPHFWLDPTQLLGVADAVAEELSVIDPDNADTYRDRAEQLNDQLTELDQRYTDGLAQCERSTIIVTHEAFGYLANRYGFEQVGISGLDPEAEPSPARIREIGDVAAREGVTTIFYEVLVSDRVARVIADDLGLEVDLLDPLEGQSNPDENYIDVMDNNLAALQRALGCQ